MSMDVNAGFYDKKGRCIHMLNLLNLNTYESYKLVYGAEVPWETYGDEWENHKLDNDVILNNYFNWLKEYCNGWHDLMKTHMEQYKHHSAGYETVEEIPTDEQHFQELKQELLNDMARWEEDYTLKWHVW